MTIQVKVSGLLSVTRGNFNLLLPELDSPAFCLAEVLRFYR